MKRIDWRLVGVIFVTTMMSLANTFAAPLNRVPSSLTMQTSREGNVIVTVTPRNLVPGASHWDFEVTLETHTQPLDQDMIRITSLIDVNGTAHAPISWEGDAPGGHHRRGVLRFKPLAGNPKVVEFRIQGIGGIEARVFRWQLGR